MTVALFRRRGALSMGKKRAMIDNSHYITCMVDRLRRLDRVFQRHPIYFITANTFDRHPILASSFVRSAVEHFARSGPDHGAWLGGYVLMPDHLHAFVALDDRRIDLSTWVKSFKNSISKTLRM